MRRFTSSSLSFALLAAVFAAPASAAMLEGDLTQQISPEAASTWMFVDGAWGRIEIGRDPADATSVGVDVTAPSAFSMRPALTGFADQADPAGDRARISYFTPRWMGLQAGASLVPDADDGKPVAVALGFRETLGPLGVDLSGRFSPAETKAGAWGLGGKLTLGGFDLGAGYQDFGAASSLAAGENDRRFDVGLGFTGAGWKLNAGIGLGWARGAGNEGPVGMISLAGGISPMAGWDLRADLNIVEMRGGAAAAGDNRGTDAIVAISSILKF